MRFFLWLLLFTGGAGLQTALAQAVPDTLVNRPLPDSLRDRVRADAQRSGELTIPADTFSTARTVLNQHTPKRAALYSALLPGAGQYYNRQYWKIPIIYAGMGTSFYFLISNTNDYRKYRTAYLASLDPLGSDNPLTRTYTSAQLKTLQDAYRQNLDMTVLFTTLGFTLQVMDALVFAHLKNFDVSRDLSIRVRPALTPVGPGIALAIRF
ncbi:MAG: hypothetical protein EOP52_08000 [Sphingobacteriales bacterium]|nr:MAG: hypothetical protein EOP52_08000 [Sphingobacteriales bacterium]